MLDRLTVYIGRFSPFHAGHAATLKRAIAKSDKVLVLIGSAFQARTIKNPWTYDERQGLIRAWSVSEDADLSDSERGRLLFAPLEDTAYNEQLWIANVQAGVNDALAAMPADTQVFLTGAEKDDSSYYLRMFPSYTLDLAHAEFDEGGGFLSATSIREKYFTNRALNDILPITHDFLIKFMRDQPDEFAQLESEYDHIEQYKDSWSAAPYPPVFQTVDAVVVQNGHVLLTQRKREPGRGLYALPGGFINEAETLFDACVRELREETRIKIPEPVLRSNFVRREIFDAPGRSLRGRTITTAHLFLLNPDHALPEVKGCDDAAWAGWVELSQVLKMREQMFEDHYDIIQAMISGSL